VASSDASLDGAETSLPVTVDSAVADTSADVSTSSDASSQDQGVETDPPVTVDRAFPDGASLDDPADSAADGDASSCSADPIWRTNSATFTVSNRPAQSTLKLASTTATRAFVRR